MFKTAPGVTIPFPGKIKECFQVFESGEVNKPQGIIVFGANGCGKTTLGRALADALGFKHMDIEEYAFAKSEIPYTNERPGEEVIKLMLADIVKYRTFVISAVTGDFSEKISRFYDLAVYISVPKEIRMERIKKRAFEQYGKRVLQGGDMYEKHLKFVDFAASRSSERIEKWAKTLVCPVIYADGTKPPDTLTDEILAYIKTRSHYDSLIDENNDPARDPEILQKYMSKWDGDGFVEALQLAPEKSVLELGVGSGRLALRVCGKCKSFTGIDLSPKTIERAKQNLQEFSNVRLICGDFLTHQFDKPFDIIYSSLTFMHIKDKQTAIQKTADLLTPGGRFVLSIDKNQQTEIDYGTRKMPVYPDKPEDITSSLTKAGLSIEKQLETEFAVVFAATKRIK